MGSAGETRPAIFAWFGIPVPFPERMRLLRDAGFGITSIWWEERNPEGRRLRHLAPGIARGFGLDIEHIHVPYQGCNDLWSDNGHRRTDALDRHLRWIEDCARHEVPTMVMHVVSGRGNHLDHARGVDSMARLLEAAERCGITIAIENTRRNDLVDLLLERLAVPHLGLCFDNAHDALHHDTPLALLRRWRDRLVTTHISDCDGKRDQHWIPGEGTLDFGELHGVLRPYEGACLLEVVPRDRNEAPEPFLRRAYAAAVRQVEGAT